MTSGDGYVTVADGTTRWGLYGAAGLLLRWKADPAFKAAGGAELFLLVRRSPTTHGGDCWGIPGGALDHGEGPVAAAVREFREEFNVDGDLNVTTGREHRDDHGGWTYTTVILHAEHVAPVHPASWEHTDAGWFTRDEIADLNLHPAFKAALPTLYALIDGPPDTAPACPGCGHHHVTDPPRCAETPCAADCPECNDTGIVWLCDLGQHTKCQGYACTCDCHGSNE